MMRQLKPLFLFTLFAFIVAVTISGCLEKTIYPELITTVVSVSPNELQPTNGSGTLDLPTVDIDLRSETQVPAKLLSYHVTYVTPMGQTLDSLQLPETPLDQFLTPGSSNKITVRPYTRAIYELFELSASNIEPIRATIILTIKDENNNITHPEAHCLLFKP